MDTKLDAYTVNVDRLVVEACVAVTVLPNSVEKLAAPDNVTAPDNSVTLMLLPYMVELTVRKLVETVLAIKVCILRLVPVNVFAANVLVEMVVVEMLVVER